MTQKGMIALLIAGLIGVVAIVWLDLLKPDECEPPPDTPVGQHIQVQP